MGLSSDLISQFVKITNDDTKQAAESTVYGTVVYDGRPYVKLDGSDLLTPVTSTTDVEDGERVTVLIKNHSAVITGNLSSPAARTDTVKEMGNQISEFEIIVADKVSTKELEVERGRIDELRTDNLTVKEKLTAVEADISDLNAENVIINEKLTARDAEIKKLQTEKLDATAADIKFATIENLEATDLKVYNLEATYGEFESLTSTKFEAVDASITKLNTEKLSATEADVKYANIDFSNIGKAAIEHFYATSGLIKDIVVGDGTITGELVGVTIKGDLIEGNTIKADKLVVKGSDGLYYKLNFEAGTFTDGEAVPTDGLHGSVIVANSITAEKIRVDDLVAFDATIGGFHITDNSLYSGVKESVDNTTRGIYLDNEGQVAFGDSTNYIKYFKDADGSYKLVISADSLLIKSGKSVEDVIDEKIDDVEVGGRNLIRNSQNLMFADYYFKSWSMDVTYSANKLSITTGAISASSDGAGKVTVKTHPVIGVSDDTGRLIITQKELT